MNETEQDPQQGWLTRERALLLVLIALTVLASYIC